MSHSKEPWRLLGVENTLASYATIQDASGEVVSAIQKSQIKPRMLADYERIVACVNACRNLTNEQLGRINAGGGFEVERPLEN